MTLLAALLSFVIKKEQERNQFELMNLINNGDGRYYRE